MLRDSRNADGGDGCGSSSPRLPEYLPNETYAVNEDDALELTLCPPGENRGCHGARSPFPYSDRFHQSNSYLQLRPWSRTSAADVESSRQDAERNRRLFAPPLPLAYSASHKRSAPAAVVGWPPIRSFRKNLAGTSSTKQSGPETRNVVSDEAINGEKRAVVPHMGSFLKINMDGVPIGRKVDIGSCGSYEKLGTTVDELFRDMLAGAYLSFVCGIHFLSKISATDPYTDYISAQTDPSGVESVKPITGLLDGTGEYTLVYEDHEGDRVLVIDVPWKMFVATARRLHVLKRSNLPVINLESSRGHGMLKLS